MSRYTTDEIAARLTVPKGTYDPELDGLVNIERRGETWHITVTPYDEDQFGDRRPDHIAAEKFTATVIRKES